MAPALEKSSGSPLYHPIVLRVAGLGPEVSQIHAVRGNSPLSFIFCNFPDVLLFVKFFLNEIDANCVKVSIEKKGVQRKQNYS